MKDDGYNSMQISPRANELPSSSLVPTVDEFTDLLKRCDEHADDCEQLNNRMEKEIEKNSEIGDKIKIDGEVEKLVSAYNKLRKISQLISEIESMENSL